MEDLASQEVDMSLSHKNKEVLHKAIILMSKLVSNLEKTPVDPRVLDLIEVCGSMLEQQIDMDIIYEQCSHTSDEISFFEEEEKDSGEITSIQSWDNTPSSEDLKNWFNLGDVSEF